MDKIAKFCPYTSIFSFQSVFLADGSEWLKSKWKGERAVLEEFPDATIIRSVDFYGPADKFLDHFMYWGRRGYK